MNLVVTFLAKFVRRRTALIGLVAGAAAVFLISTYSTSNKRESWRDAYAQRLVGAHKRLQQADQNNIEAVQFIPGVPGHSSRNLPQEAPNHSGEARAQLYAAQARLHDPAQGRLHEAAAFRARAEGPVYKSASYQTLSRNHLNYKSGKAYGGAADQQNGIFREENINPVEADSNVEYGEGRQQQYRAYGQQNARVPVYIPHQERDGNRLAVVARGEEDSTDAGADAIYIPPHRIVHLDLKGAPPKVDYLKKVLPIIKRLGGTGIMIEWEDMFPFTGRLSGVPAENHYSMEEVKEILATIKDLGLEVIPLVQTFGHMEFVLKLAEFAHLRDVEDMPESICPCHNNSLPLIAEIIDQIMAVHKSIKYLHIGCDEVYHLGTCAPCQERASGAFKPVGEAWKRLPPDRNQLFVEHVLSVAHYAADKYGVQPIIWDDMLRGLMEEEMQPLSALVEPMVWVYAEDVYRFVPQFTWERYSRIFDYIWTSSAFKGAHGETLVVPNAGRHLVNNLNWVTLMQEEGRRLKGGFRGIAITGWQRYDHFSVLCELLPAGLPSLALDLLVVSSGYFNESIGPPLYKALGCAEHSKYQGFLNLDTDSFLWDKMSWCTFPGSNFFRLTRSYVYLDREVTEFLAKADKKKGWLTLYSRTHNYSSPFRIDEIMEDWSRYQHEVVNLMKSASSALLEVYDYHTEGEWIEQKIYPLYKKLSELRQESDRLKSYRSWSRRPLDTIDTLKQLGIGVPATPSAPPATTLQTQRPKRRVQAPDLYSSRARLRSLGHR